ncbi:MAG: DUF7472 family protein [Halobacteriota archaeon]
MEIDAELRRQIAVSLLAVVIFLGAVLYIGSAENGSEGLSADGAIAIVGALTGFVLLMAIVGFYLARSG